MSEAGAPAEGDLMSRLRENGVTQLRLIYHDCSGRPQVKSAPSDRFAEVIARGVNFAKANLDYYVLDEQVPGRCFRRPHRRLPRGSRGHPQRHTPCVRTARSRSCAVTWAQSGSAGQAVQDVTRVVSGCGYAYPLRDGLPPRPGCDPSRTAVEAPRRKALLLCLSSLTDLVADDPGPTPNHRD